MSQKRQSALFVPSGRPGVQVTSLAYDFADGHVVEEHFHQDGQLLFASQGVMTVRTGNELWVVPPLRAVWIPPGRPHEIVMSGVVRMRTLYFTSALSRRAPKRCAVVNVSALLRELILHACARSEWRRRVATEQRLIDLLLDQLRVAPVAPLQLPQPRDARARRVAERLLADPADRRTLAELARGAGASKRTLERAFLDDTGLTFGRWRQQLRLLHGMRRLAAGEKVTAAALDAGYHSPSAFIAVFRKALGYTPKRGQSTFSTY